MPQVLKLELDDQEVFLPQPDLVSLSALEVLELKTSVPCCNEQWGEVVMPLEGLVSLLTSPKKSLRHLTISSLRALGSHIDYMAEMSSPVTSLRFLGIDFETVDLVLSLLHKLPRLTHVGIEGDLDFYVSEAQETRMYNWMASLAPYASTDGRLSLFVRDDDNFGDIMERLSDSSRVLTSMDQREVVARLR